MTRPLIVQGDHRHTLRSVCRRAIAGLPERESSAADSRAGILGEICEGSILLFLEWMAMALSETI
jgi:hypothetical protein